MPQNLTEQLSREQQIAALEKDWANNPRWKGVKRGYSAADVVRLRGSLQIEHTLAKRGADKLWRLINGEAPTVDQAYAAHTSPDSRPDAAADKILASSDEVRRSDKVAALRATTFVSRTWPPAMKWCARRPASRTLWAAASTSRSPTSPTSGWSTSPLLAWSRRRSCLCGASTR